MIKTIRKNGLILGAFALATTSIIAITYNFTHERIERAKERQLLNTLNQVVPKAMHDNELHLDCLRVDADPQLGNKSQRVFRSRLNNKNTALIIETTAPDGYSGAIDLVVAIDTQNTVLGARVVAHKETPGLGDKIEARISDWILKFSGTVYSPNIDKRWRVKKDGGQFDQFTGATITPRAVVSAIKQAAIYGQKNQQALFSNSANCLDLQAAQKPSSSTSANDLPTVETTDNE